MRKNFYEILSNMKFDYVKEYNTLLYLFRDETCTGHWSNRATLAQYISGNYFRELSFRGTFTTLESLMNAIPIKSRASSLEDLFVLSEFLMAVLPEDKTNENWDVHNQAQTIKGNIRVILEQTNHELISIPGAEDCLIIAEKNKGTTRAVEIVEDEMVAIDLLEYNHFALKGNLAQKKKILTSIGAYIEPILKSRILQNAGYKKLESDMGFILNNFHIRHNNKDGAKAQDYILSCSDIQLEEWYDRAYNMAVAVIIINEHLPVEEEIAKLKRDYNWKV